MKQNKYSPQDEASAANRRALHRDELDSVPPAIYPGRIPLQGPLVTLEALDPRVHGPALFEEGHASEAALDIWTYLPYGPFADAGAMHDWLRNCSASADPVFVALRDTQNGRLGGMASFLEIRPLFGVIEIGHIWFAPHLQRTPHATEALFLMMCHAMDDLENRRLEWKCNSLNQGSRNAALRLGFRYEGVFYNHLTPKGRNRDTAWYSIMDSEWPAIRTNIASWLAEDNFDAAGNQRKSLSELNHALW
jgi:RimJ/RimL family protein N-acetyltransferase